MVGHELYHCVVALDVAADPVAEVFGYVLIDPRFPLCWGKGKALGGEGTRGVVHDPTTDPSGSHVNSATRK